MPSGSEAPVSAQTAVIDVAEVSIDYRSYRTVTRRVPLLGSSLRLRRRERVEALRGVSVSVEPGTVLGVIGRNGAGKSTLLRAIAGIVPPTQGRVTVRGEVSAFLARGVGFNNELSGRENVMLGGLAAGLSPAQVRERFDAIVSFSQLEHRLDFPVRTYSSGMAARLAFSVAVHLDPTILLIDEALSAGDGAFKQQCRDKMRELCGQGRTAVIVSHGLGTVRDLTTRCIWLDDGRVRAEGGTDEVVDAYMRHARISARATWDEDDD